MALESRNRYNKSGIFYRRAAEYAEVRRGEVKGFLVIAAERSRIRKLLTPSLRTSALSAALR